MIKPMFPQSLICAAASRCGRERMGAVGTPRIFGEHDRDRHAGKVIHLLAAKECEDSIFSAT